MTTTVFSQRLGVAVPCGCVLGEAPLWDARHGLLHWVDIKSGTLWSWPPGEPGASARTRDVGEPVGFVRLTVEPGILLLGLKSGVARYDLRTGERELRLRPEPDRPGNRLNDADVLADGSLLFGSMDDAEREETGRFYRWTARGLERFGPTAVVTNGPAVDAARRLCYTADTQRGLVYRHSVRPDGGLDPGDEFLTFGPEDGQPDGLTVDAEGHLWVCHWGGARITRFDPDGRPTLIVPVPTGLVTKLAFAGGDLGTAYVTTASIGRDREVDPLAGHLFSFTPGVRGQAVALADPHLPRVVA